LAAKLWPDPPAGSSHRFSTAGFRGLLRSGRVKEERVRCVKGMRSERRDEKTRGKGGTKKTGGREGKV